MDGLPLPENKTFLSSLESVVNRKPDYGLLGKTR
jgi:hypothetical protein